MSTALIAVEGVLGEHSTIGGFQPIGEGVRLAKSLRSEYQIVFSTIQKDERSVEFWARTNGMGRPGFYENLMYRENRWTDLVDPVLLSFHAHELRAAGHDLNLVVSSDPQAVLLLSKSGFPCLFFVNPSYRWAEYRPDNKRLPKPWQDIDDEMAHQAELKLNDPRLKEMEPDRS